MLAEQVHDAICIALPSPDGSMSVIFSEEKGKVIQIQIFIGKAGSTLRAWATSFAEVMTLGLQRGVTVDDFYNVLVEQTSDKNVMLKPGYYIHSGPEAVAVAILKYKAFKYSQLSKELSLDEDDDEQSTGYFLNPGRK